MSKPSFFQPWVRQAFWATIGGASVVLLIWLLTRR